MTTAREGIEYLLFTTVSSFISFTIVYSLSLFFAKKIGAEQTVRRLIQLIRLLIVLEIVLLIILISFKYLLGPPFQIHVITDFGNGDSWIYGYGRPFAGLALIPLGLLCDMHVAFLYISLAGCIIETALDSIAVIQVSNYQAQVTQYNAPPGQYTPFDYSLYIWRDCFSISICLFLCLSYIYVLSLTGWFRGRRSLNFRQIEGGLLDRSAVMRKHLALRTRFMPNKRH